MRPNSQFSKFERLAQELIEGTFGRLLGGSVEPQIIASKLAQTMENSSYDGEGRMDNTYDVFLHESDLEEIRAKYPTLGQELANYLVQLGNQANLPVSDLPVVRFNIDSYLRTRQVRVVGSYDGSRDTTQTRKQHKVRLDKSVMDALQELDAFLIIDGQEHVSLSSSMVTIGRRIDNDIILDVPTVSRKHAQIRWRYSHFIIYDLGSRAGVLINDQKVRECVLQPGDVIKISNKTLIYGEGLNDTERPKTTAQQDSNTVKYKTLTRLDEPQGLTKRLSADVVDDLGL